MRKGRFLLFVSVILISLLLTSCFNAPQSSSLNQDNIKINSLETLVGTLQLRIEEFLMTINQNARDIRKNENEIESLKEAINKNHDYIDTLYSSITYSGVMSSRPNITDITPIPTLEEIRSMMEVENRKTLSEFESRIQSVQNVKTANDDNYDETVELDRLQQEIAILKDNFRTIKWQMYSEPASVLSEQQYPVYDEQITYVIQSGDTLSQISDAFDLGYNGVNQIMVDNGITDPRGIKRGQELVITTRPIYESIVIPLYGRSNIIPEDIDAFFGEKTLLGFSRGLAFKTEKDQQIVSCLTGKVIDVGSSYIVIYHGNEMKLVYSGIKAPLVSKGEWVKPDQIIAQADEEQFILEFLLNSEYRDPMNLFLKKMGVFRITFYTEWEDGNLPYFPYFRRVKEGSFAREWYSVAADPDVFEKGTMLYIPELKNTPSRGLFLVQDEGSAIKGQKIDVYIRDLTLASKLQTTATVYSFRDD